MANRILRTEQVWAFGKRYDFNLYEVIDGAGNRVNLHQDQYSGNAANPTRRQKNQIVLHYTAGNNPAQGAINWWNTLATLPNWICRQYFTLPHQWGYAHRYRCPVAGCGQEWSSNRNCPIHNVRVAIRCPTGHGTLVRGKKAASAQYIVELSQDRLTPATQTYSDVIEVVESDYVSWHAGAVNDNSIGIEIGNVGWNWVAARHDAMNGAGAARRPVDQNRWFHSNNPIRGNRDFQAYQEEQYLALILLLRSLCIEHRISRRFLGETTDEKMMRWWHRLPRATEALTRSKLMRFRGILSHMNVHDTKSCGGPALDRNRLFRGIIDEWWLPVQQDGIERKYYSGPFDPANNVPSFFRWQGGHLHADLFHDANLDALQETKSYFDFDKLEWYYAQTETAAISGGTFPIGKNKTWHGGIHLVAAAANAKVYAAASGTIVAARLGTDAAIETDRQYGSQRFVLIRHCVYLEQEADPDGGTRVNYNVDPVYIFSLYMHVAAVANLAAADNNNPPWFNYWRRRNPGADANGVFNPNIEVHVGDWIGQCGTFQGRQIIHFELVSMVELNMAPWDNANYRAYDSDDNLVCNSATLDRFVNDITGDGIDRLDVLRAAKDMRRIKSYHKSEWAMSSADQLTDLIPSRSLRESTWEKLRKFMWVADAVNVNPDIAAQLCDASGFMWHYHPVTFMAFVNRLVLEENGEVEEPDMRNTNVVMEGGYLTRYVDYSTGAPVVAQADNQRLRPFDVSINTYEYRFNRSELACRAPGAHNPGPTPPTGTKFSVALLDLLESIRRRYNRSITCAIAYICSGHHTPANHHLCACGTDDGLSSHAKGHAIDIRPSGANAARCQQLWNAASSAVDEYNVSAGDYGGEPSRTDLPGTTSADLYARPDIQAKLQAGTPLDAGEVANCIIHLELVSIKEEVLWECWIRKISQAIHIKLHGGGIIGVYGSRALAEQEMERDAPWQKPWGWECWVRKTTRATRVKLHGGGIIAVFSSWGEAEAEKAADYAWPKEN